MNKQLEIDYSFGYVFDKSKLIVMYPIGSNIINEDEYEMEVEVAFLEDGIEIAFEENDIKEAHDVIKPLEMFLMKPSKIVPFVTSIKDANTKEELPRLLKEFDEEYKIKDNYIDKGYEIQDMYNVFENVVKYIPQENLDTLSILKIEADKFDMDNFVKFTRENLDEAIDESLIPVNMVKSTLTNRLFIKSDEKNITVQYIVFATDISSYSEGILCCNKEIIKDLDIDMGDLEISKTMDVGYLVENDNGVLNFKIANFNSKTQNNNQIAQIVDYSGVFKPMMIEFLNQFTK
ncbi:MAG: hypothetical protein ACRC3Y_09050 [Romboutsia sp.]|uniref:hypothetical protein n=1 Tax=Romboutsia sp. TaxID=1965302 RepID=UPI003F3B4629